ncbi:MAG: hypothetical protein QGG38_05480 [Nitrospinaceae bacterium]|nr:hypothetical protein [Nitrospinaceae bacterium]MDP6712125.1 hypothetical protein [Nitrospinaceae bacterium]
MRKSRLSKAGSFDGAFCCGYNLMGQASIAIKMVNTFKRQWISLKAEFTLLARVFLA